MRFETRFNTYIFSVIISVISAFFMCAEAVSLGNSTPSMATVHTLVASGQAKFQVIDRKNLSEKTEVELVLVDQEGHSIGGYAPPYLGTQAEARGLWQDFVSASLSLTVPPEQMSIAESRRAEDQSFAVGFVLDHSPSMTTPRAVRMQRAIQSALRTFDESDFTTVVKFTGSVITEVPLSGNPEEFLSKFQVNGLKSRNGGTAIYDAMMEAMNQLANAPNVSERIIVLFTDGEDNSSAATLDEVISRAKELKVIVHAVVYGISNEAPIKRIAEETQGRVHRLNDVYDFDKVFLGIYNALRHSYTVTVQHKQDISTDRILGATMTATGSSLGAVKTREVMAMVPERATIAQTPTDQTLVLNIELQFDDSSVEVNSEAIPMLDSLATLLIQRRDLALEILNEGGKQATSQDASRLLQLRTQAIRELLIRRGVPPSRIQSYAGKAATANPSFRFSDPGKTTFVFTKL
ncbi:MAG: VWA domain-containing protein [Ignavibacteria bacterium]|nr:VWA domain-containing protein [Ignavibacteria bacterium]